MKKIFIFFAVALTALSLHAAEVTVADGTATNASLPLCSYYFDFGFHGQMLYSAELIDAVAGSSISSLTFYTSTEEQAWGAGTVSVKLAEVDETELTVTPLAPEFTEVYNGALSIVGGEMVVTFTTPFTYSGSKNLLLDIDWGNKGTASSGDVYFYGAEVSKAGFSTRIKQGTYTYSAAVVDFLPKTTFETEGESGVTCARPSKLAAAATPDGAVFTWEGEEEQYQWCVVDKDAEPAGWALVEAKTCTAKGLTAGKEYDFYVRTYCDAESQSKEAKLTFSPVCNAPAEVEMSDLTHASVKFSWAAVAGIEKYQFVCLRADSTPDWSSVEAQAVLTASIDTLQPQTSYAFYVRSWFNAETQSDAVKVAFTTNCVARTLPFSENFDAAAELPACWEAENYGTSGNQWGISEWYDCKSEAYSARYNARSSSNTPSDLKTAAVELSENALLKFWYKNAVTAEVYIHDGSKETLLLNVPSKSNWTEETIDLSDYTGKIVSIIFRGHANNKSQYFYVDDVQLVAKPCETPTQVKADVSSTGAVVTWTAGGDEAEWNLRHKAVEADEWTEVKALTENTYTITGLVSGIEYEVQVQAACAADKLSDWSASATFTPQCPVPAELAVKILEDNRAVVAWECTESVFNLQYKAADAEEWTTVEAIEAKSHELTNLAAATTYEVKVQTACGSDYTDAVSFTTRCAPLAEAIPYVLNMDSVTVGSMPECWFVLPSSAEVTVALMNDDTHRLQIAGQQECWIVLPALETELSGLTVSVDWTGSALKEIGYLTAADPETFVAITDFSDATVECNMRNAAADAKYVAFHYLGTTSYSIGYISEVRIVKTSDETALTNTTATKAAVKRVENGQVVIIKNGVRFNVLGTELK